MSSELRHVRHFSSLVSCLVWFSCWGGCCVCVFVCVFKGAVVFVSLFVFSRELLMTSF